jgi:hypothetical protein
MWEGDLGVNGTIKEWAGLKWPVILEPSVVFGQLTELGSSVAPTVWVYFQLSCTKQLAVVILLTVCPIPHAKARGTSFSCSSENAVIVALRVIKHWTTHSCC